jgi:4,5:9,10-diseco-3-hydroxy-5,9,17-trioxoandrosta-1(10),2-diene-4-oate hydrolase
MRPGPGGPPEALWRDPRLTRLPHETLIMCGREDRVLPLDTGMILLKQIPADGVSPRQPPGDARGA